MWEWRKRWEDEEIFDCFDVRSCSILLRSDDRICRSSCFGSTGAEWKPCWFGRNRTKRSTDTTGRNRRRARRIIPDRACRGAGYLCLRIGQWRERWRQSGESLRNAGKSRGGCESRTGHRESIHNPCCVWFDSSGMREILWSRCDDSRRGRDTPDGQPRRKLRDAAGCCPRYLQSGVDWDSNCQCTGKPDVQKHYLGWSRKTWRFCLCAGCQSRRKRRRCAK